MIDNEYTPGDIIELLWAERDSNGAVVNPSTLHLILKDPDGNETTKTLFAGDIVLLVDDTYAAPYDSGCYRYRFDTTGKGLTASERWSYRWEASGNTTGADEGIFYIKRTRFTG